MGEAKRRKETGAPPPQKGKSNKLLYAGIGLLALAAVLLGVFFLTAPPKPTSDGLPVAAPNAEDFPAQWVPRMHRSWCVNLLTTNAPPAATLPLPASS